MITLKAFVLALGAGIAFWNCSGDFGYDVALATAACLP
ncbi:hypothetical protein Bra471DRAFT_02116 [Bradyrhizobium sp. WSM471]|nr:hypothetical protein Bra471DRAFT_02116 [Bradyrhizobium sp. WSM471]